MGLICDQLIYSSSDLFVILLEGTITSSICSAGRKISRLFCATSNRLLMLGDQRRREEPHCGALVVLTCNPRWQFAFPLLRISFLRRRAAVVMYSRSDTASAGEV
jgi:hypothetical protein